ncbi:MULTISPECIES: DUF3164 family protein [unclassified Pseudomonas]|uniref:DUF3164 family protein n=1 Tax=unclassified Pseudomonas TaxID=196821 RepID=UPI002160BB44|nr:MULTISPECIES: DUF3164 family protein [unclassified Pseudomonas]UVM52175.1 DUF3164 family protein [Pseudomonas sp. B21-015]WPN60387.1 DUF3164 family protein [Pseudomonas sp. P9_31]
MATNDILQVPAGYRVDALGRMVPEASIKPTDLLRDKLVMEAIDQAKAISAMLLNFKERVFGDIDALEQISKEQYGVVSRGTKGNLTLTSYDGRYKLMRANQDQIEFNEHLQSAKALLDECAHEWTANSHPGVRVLINDAFRADRNGELRTSRILSLRRHDIDDSRWKRAMEAIGDAIQVAGSRSYIRLYERVGDTDRYEAISLDLAGV